MADGDITDPRVEDGVRHYEIHHGETPPTSFNDPSENDVQEVQEASSYDHFVKTDNYKEFAQVMDESKFFENLSQESDVYHGAGMEVRVTDGKIEYSVENPHFEERDQALQEFVEGVFRGVEGANQSFRDEIYQAVSNDYSDFVTEIDRGESVKVPPEARNHHEQNVKQPDHPNETVMPEADFSVVKGLDLDPQHKKPVSD